MIMFYNIICLMLIISETNVSKVAEIILSILILYYFN